MNKRRKEIEDKIVELMKKSPAEAADFVFFCYSRIYERDLGGYLDSDRYM